eukprot:1244049-Ditylum_brightwellii.AAC.1
MNSLTLTELATYSSAGALLSINGKGNVVSNEAIVESKKGLNINEEVQFTENIDIGDKEISNAHFVSGSIKGNNIDVKVKSVLAEPIVLLHVQHSKTTVLNSLVIVDKNGDLKDGPISLENGWLKDVKVAETINLHGFSSDDDNIEDVIQGTIADTIIKGECIDGIFFGNCTVPSENQ